MRLSKNVEAFRPSPIRAMLRVVSNPNIISFAGGMPGEDFFQSTMYAKWYKLCLAK